MIGDRPRSIADDQRIAVIVEKNHHSHAPYSYLPPYCGPGATDDHAHNARHTAVSRNDTDHATDHQGEKNDGRMIFVSQCSNDVDLESIK